MAAILDQLTKAMVVATIGPQSARTSVQVVDEWLFLEYAENRGVVFGLLAGAGPLLIVVAIAVILVLLKHSLSSAAFGSWEITAVGMIVGGALGNLIDRMRHGFVVDFVSVGWWPSFNFADSAITVGVAMLIWTWFSPRTVRDDATLS